MSGRLGGTLSSRIEVTNGKSQASIVILQEDQPCDEEELFFITDINLINSCIPLQQRHPFFNCRFLQRCKVRESA